MKILINTATTFKGGGVQVAKSFIEECKKFDKNEYYVVLSSPLSQSIHQLKFPENFRFFKAPFRPATKIISFRSHNKFLKNIEKNWKPEIVFTTSGPSYWRPKVPHLMGYNLPHYIYPESHYFKLISLKMKLYWFGMKIFARYVFRRDADAIVVQTDDVNRRVKKFLSKQKVKTVYNTINTHFINQNISSKKLPEKKIDGFRLLTLSAWYPHKNLSIIPKVVKALKEKGYKDISFIVTLPDVDFRKLDLEEENDIINVGPIKVEEAPSLYKECDAMFLPTLLECFSASYVEAMKMEKPIITSDMGFAHTICENAAIYVNPVDARDIADKIIELFNSKSLQFKLVKNGLNRLNYFGTPENRAMQYLQICKTLID